MKVELMALMETLDHQKKNFIINFTKANTKFCLSLHYNADNSYLLVNPDNTNVNFPTQFCLGSISNGFSNTEFKEVSLSRNVNHFSVNYSSIDKSNIINIQKCLMTKYNIK